MPNVYPVDEQSCVTKYMSNICLFVVEQSSDDEIKGDIQQRYMYYSIKNPMQFSVCQRFTCQKGELLYVTLEP